MKLKGMENYNYWRGYGLDHTYLDVWNKREKHIVSRGFPIVTKETFTHLVKLLTGKKVLDIGAGTGYLSYHLQKSKIDVTPIVKSKNDYTFKRNFFTKRIIKADCLEMDVSNYNTFILSWPCYGSDHAYKFLLRMKKGDILIYQGEERGCCATDDFFDELNESFNLLETDSYLLNVKHVRFRSLHDSWFVYIKR